MYNIIFREKLINYGCDLSEPGYQNLNIADPVFRKILHFMMMK